MPTACKTSPLILRFLIGNYKIGGQKINWFLFWTIYRAKQVDCIQKGVFVSHQREEKAIPKGNLGQGQRFLPFVQVGDAFIDEFLGGFDNRGSSLGVGIW